MIAIKKGQVDGAHFGGESLDYITLFTKMGNVPLNSPLEIEAVLMEGSRDWRWTMERFNEATMDNDDDEWR